MNQRPSFGAPTHRAAKPPKCQALRLHLRALATVRAPEPPALCVPPALGRLFMRVAGAA